MIQLNIFYIIKELIIMEDLEKTNLKDYQQLIKDNQFEEAERIGDSYFCEGSIPKAIEVYQAIIEGGYTTPFEIQGLGSAEHSISRYEWFVYKWYDQQRKSGKIKGNVYDALSLCYNKIRFQKYQSQKGILWYEDMLGAKEGYELYMGYANLLSNKSRYEEAIKFYNRVIMLRPKFINAYVNIAMIHEYRRIEKSKSVAMAKKILQIDPNNMYGVFILARNQQDINKKIQSLQFAAEKFPEYVRITNDVGIAFGSKKQHKQAIKWYKKCIETAPEYASAYNNVGVRTQMLKQYEEALVWYFKSCELDPQYKAAHSNATDIFDILKYDDERIIQQMKKYPKLNPFMFYYYLGLAYYDKNKVHIALKWYKKAQQLDRDNFQLMNSIGIAYDQIKQLDRAEEYYLICIALNPQYHMAYYNLGILEKARNNIDKAITWYRRATQVNPRYNKPYNNLGNIYKNRKQYDEAISCYEKAVQLNSTYTLGWANLAICLLNQERYQDAFNAFARAKQLLPHDNNSLSEGNKSFLKDNLEKFDQEGEKWRKTCSISHDQKQNLRYLIHSYESNFKQSPSNLQAAPISNQIALKPQMLEIVNLIYKDQFLLKESDRILDAVKSLCKKDIQYFHIIPLIFIQFFQKSIFQLSQHPLKAEQQVSKVIKFILQKVKPAENKKVAQFETINERLGKYGYPDSAQVNLFEESSFFDSYQSFYSQIQKINNHAQQSLNEFIELVEAVRIRSNGVSCGTSMTLPKRANQQFAIMTVIIQQILSKQINQQWKTSIITKLGDFVLKEGEKATSIAVIHHIIDMWSDQITLILKHRFDAKIETVCKLGNLLKGQLIFDNIEDLLKAVDACDKLSHLKGYQIIELSNKPLKDEALNVKLKVKMNKTVCQLKLAVKQGEDLSDFINSLEQIEHSPLGCIFGSYIYMSKGFKYPLLANCKDIEARLKGTASQGTAEAARYIIDVLQAKP